MTNIDGMIKMRRRQLLILEKTQGLDDRETNRIRHNLGCSLRDAGKLAEAESLLMNALEHWVRMFGAESIEAAAGYNALGELMKLKGDVTQAIEWSLKALAIREQELGPEHESTQLVRHRLLELGVDL